MGLGLGDIWALGLGFMVLDCGLRGLALKAPMICRDTDIPSKKQLSLGRNSEESCALKINLLSIQMRRPSEAMAVDRGEDCDRRLSRDGHKNKHRLSFKRYLSLQQSQSHKSNLVVLP